MRFSNSSIKAYEQCPFKYKLTRIDGLKEPTGEAAERGKTIHTEFEFALMGIGKINDERSYWNDYIEILKSHKARPELKVGITKNWLTCDFDDPDVWLRGVVDAIYETDNSVHILDWKTGKERDYADQLNLYAAVAFAIYPHIEKVSTEICYIDHNKHVNYGYVYRKQFEELKQWVTNRITKIENDDVYAPNPTYGCKWCHFRKSNGGPCQW
jgi:RecB family exonuclease